MSEAEEAQFQHWIDEIQNGVTEKLSQIAELQAEVEQLRKWQEAAFDVHPNIDLDIAALEAGE